MSLYSLICNPSPLTPLLLKILGTDEKKVERCRDTFINLAGVGPAIEVYTRTGGTNRPQHEPSNQALAALEGYLDDHDCKFDSTFACFRFRIPSPYKARVVRLQQILAPFGAFKSPENKFAMAISSAPPKQQPERPDAADMAELNKILKSIDADLAKPPVQ